jgi:hypothetical protein
LYKKVYLKLRRLVTEELVLIWMKYKVRWKKVAFENCTGVRCTTGPGTGGAFSCGTSTVADIDGNSYHTVSIGTQC